MNYIQQINGFWAKAESDDLTGNDIAVYMALLKYCNSLNWLTPFVCHWEIVCQYSKVSKNTYYKSLNRLDGLGYIKYTEGKKNVLKPKIVILKFENRKGIVKEQHEEQNEEQKGNLYKLVNDKTYKLINNNIDLINERLEYWIESETKTEESDKISFVDFWNSYDKKIGSKEKCKTKWDKLPLETQKVILDHVKKYVNSTPDKKYRCNPETYLNQNRWENEIIGEQKTDSQYRKTEDGRIFLKGVI